LPITYFDNVYGKYYRAVSNRVFKNFGEHGFAFFKETKDKTITHFEIGNSTQVLSNGYTPTATFDFNTKSRGYIPTALLISLILSAPVSLRRKTIAILVGMVMITALIMVKQWYNILYMAIQKKELALFNFSESEQERIMFIYNNYTNYSGPTLILAVAIWMLVTFRRKDFEGLFNPVIPGGNSRG
jgi:hypothetical protein